MGKITFHDRSRRTGRERLPIPLTKEEEKICVLCLTTKYKEEAKETLILHNLRLVRHIANHFYHEFCTDNQLTKEELVSDGQYGLVKAAGTFSKERETSFSTYAYCCIQNQMLYELRNREKQTEGLPFDDDRSKKMLEDLYGVQYVEDPVFEYVHQKIRREKICEAYETLDDEEKVLLAYRYFMTEENSYLFEAGQEGKKYKRSKELCCSQKDVSKLLGISQSYVARLEKNVLYKIKKKANCGTIVVEKYRKKG